MTDQKHLPGMEPKSMAERLCFLDVAAREKLKVPPDWEVGMWRCLDDGSVLCELRQTWRGKRGKKNWGKEKRTCVVTQGDVTAEQIRYENRTGNCHVCQGTGDEWRRWSADKGNEFKTCTRCIGSGRKPQ